ncbi:MAG: hypothetical protein UU72_C0051G0001, partial [candidate division WWE3 bacterium GW2011_GWB1_41_6]
HINILLSSWVEFMHFIIMLFDVKSIVVNKPIGT